MNWVLVLIAAHNEATSLPARAERDMTGVARAMIWGVSCGRR